MLDKSKQVLEHLWNMQSKLIWLNEYIMKQSFGSCNPSEVHCIEYIGKNEDSNVTKLAEDFYMTKGAISKITKKMLNKGLIESYQKADNKKEIFFRLTESGQEIFNIHENLHIEFSERDKCVYEAFSENELDVIINFAKQYEEHLNQVISELGINSRTGDFDKL